VLNGAQQALTQDADVGTSQHISDAASDDDAGRITVYALAVQAKVNALIQV
jgi:hypothetical protein